MAATSLGGRLTDLTRAHLEAIELAVFTRDLVDGTIVTDGRVVSTPASFPTPSRRRLQQGGDRRPFQPIPRRRLAGRFIPDRGRGSPISDRSPHATHAARCEISTSGSPSSRPARAVTSSATSSARWVTALASFSSKVGT